MPVSYTFTLSHHPWALGVEEKGEENQNDLKESNGASCRASFFLCIFSPFLLNNPCLNYYWECLLPPSMFSAHDRQPYPAQLETGNEQKEGLANSIQTSSNLWKTTGETL